MKNIGDLTGIASTEIVGFGKDRPMADFANLGLNVDQRSSYSSSLADIIPIANIDNYKSLPSYEEIANWASEESIPSIYNE